MEWNIHSAIMIGSEHEQSKRNRQDFCAYFLPEDKGKQRYGGIICDGCSAGTYSETGAALIGTFILNFIRNNDVLKPDSFGRNLEKHLCRYIHDLLKISSLNNMQDKVNFIRTFLLTTFIFTVIEEDIIIIGQSGDGVIIIDDNIDITDQDGKPNYIAYREIPEEYFIGASRPKDDFFISIYSAPVVEKIVIASDGLVPLISAQRHSELFGTQKRQLQRKFNVWQQKEKLFYDDAACIVFEKIIETPRNTTIEYRQGSENNEYNI